MNIVEIYGLYDPETDELRYVGKAKNTAWRLARHIYERGRNRPICKWVHELYERGLVPVARVLERVEIDDWEKAERRLIAEHRKAGRLLNVADGGAMPCNPPRTRLTRKELRQIPERRAVVELAASVRRLRVLRTKRLKSGDYSLAYQIKFRLGLSSIPC